MGEKLIFAFMEGGSSVLVLADGLLVNKRWISGPSKVAELVEHH